MGPDTPCDAGPRGNRTRHLSFSCCVLESNENLLGFSQARRPTTPTQLTYTRPLGGPRHHLLFSFQWFGNLESNQDLSSQSRAYYLCTYSRSVGLEGIEPAMPEGNRFTGGVATIADNP